MLLAFFVEAAEKEDFWRRRDEEKTEFCCDYLVRISHRYERR